MNVNPAGKPSPKPAFWRALRERDVLQQTGLSKTHLRRLIARGDFPAPVKLSERCSAWDSRAVEAWLEAKFVKAG